MNKSQIKKTLSSMLDAVATRLDEGDFVEIETTPMHRYVFERYFASTQPEDRLTEDEWSEYKYKCDYIKVRCEISREGDDLIVELYDNDYERFDII